MIAIFVERRAVCCFNPGKCDCYLLSRGEQYVVSILVSVIAIFVERRAVCCFNPGKCECYLCREASSMLFQSW